MSSRTVLTCEDDADLRDAVTIALSQAGFKVLSASDGAEGVKLALEHHPDVILMDVMMPSMSGHEAVEKIRQDTWGQDVKIIFLTSMSDPENVTKAIKAGSEEYIVKPHASLEDIVKKVRLTIHT